LWRAEHRWRRNFTQEKHMSLITHEINNASGAGTSIAAVQSVLAPALEAARKNFEETLSRRQGTETTSQDLLAMQVASGEMQIVTQLTTDLLKTVKDLNSAVIKNMQ
jgi:hypothetical protein